jgi:hypothetical protein
VERRRLRPPAFLRGAWLCLLPSSVDLMKSLRSFLTSGRNYSVTRSPQATGFWQLHDLKILLDSGFPVSATSHRAPNVVLHLWEGDAVTDAEFVRHAAAGGYAGVVTLGRNSLAREDLLDAIEATRIALVVTHSDDPVKAEEELSHHLRRLGRLVGPSAVLVAQVAGVKVGTVEMARAGVI